MDNFWLIFWTAAVPTLVTLGVNRFDRWLNKKGEILERIIADKPVLPKDVLSILGYVKVAYPLGWFYRHPVYEHYMAEWRRAFEQIGK
jgi:hypothetical protein